MDEIRAPPLHRTRVPRRMRGTRSTVEVRRMHGDRSREIRVKVQGDNPNGWCQVNLSRSEKPEAGCAITLPPPHSAIRSSLRVERSIASIARRDGVEG